MPLQNSVERLGLRDRARKTVEDEAVRAVEPHPVLDQFDDDLVRDELAVLRVFRRLNSKQRPKFHFPAQNRAGRRHRNSKMPRDHFGLRPFSGTRCAEEHESSFHLASVEENSHAADNDDGNADIEPHQSRAPGRLTARVSGAIEPPATDATYALA